MTLDETTQNDYPLYELIISWLDRHGMGYASNPERSYIAFCVLRKSGRWEVVIEVDEQYRQVFFYSQLDMFVPEDRQQAIMEFMTRANHGMRQGHFELCFKIGIPFNELAPSDKQISDLVNCVIGVTIQYFPGLMAVIYGGQSPKAAIESIEMLPSSPLNQPLH